MNLDNSLISQSGKTPLIEQFPLLATVPNGVALLRELILQLGVRGKLGTQDISDEPAITLLERITLAKRQAVKKDTIKQEKYCKPTDEMSFGLPKKWIRTPLGTIISLEYGESLPEINRDNSGKVPVYGSNGIVGYHSRAITKGPALIIGRKGSVGAIQISLVPCHPIDTAYFLDNFDHLDCKFVLHLLTSLKLGALDKSTAIPGLNRNDAYNILIGLPPLAEQHRIVEKVDRLMALCDILEAQQRKEHEIRVRHGTAALAALQNAKDSEELEKWWWYVEENFDGILDCLENVGTLRKKIRQLAVQGRLVMQDPAEEPASILLEKIREEKERLIKYGKLQKEKLSKLPNCTGFPPNIPKGWEWTNFGQITFNRDGERIPIERAERATRPGPYDYYGASGVIDTIDDYLFDKPLLLIGEDGANLVNRSTPIAFMAYGKYWVNNHAHVIDGISLDFLQYLELYINSIDLVPYLTGMAQPKMNQAKMNSIPVPLPPLTEQHRIIEKVDRLMALCDKMEAQIREREAAQERFAKATINQIINAPISTV